MCIYLHKQSREKSDRLTRTHFYYREEKGRRIHRVCEHGVFIRFLTTMINIILKFY